MSYKPTPRAGGSAPRATAAQDNHSRKAGPTAATSNQQFDLRNPNTLATAGEDEDYDAETAAILNLDEIGASSRGVKRNAVNLDGYESDSSNEGFGGGKVDEDINAFDLSGGHGGGLQESSGRGGEKNKKKKGKKSGSDDEDDMFGGGDSDDEDAAGEDAKKKGGGGGGKKGVRFLELNEIEGQELSGKRNGRDENASSSDDDGDQEEEEDDDPVDEEVGAGGKKKNAPKMDGFHMRAEMEEGRFDSAGNFVRKAADADAVHDTWLEGVTKKEMKRAKESHDKREQEARAKMMEDDALITAEIIASLVRCLQRGETALEGLARLAPQRKPKQKKTWQERRKQKSGAMDSEPTTTTTATTGEAEVAAETKRKQQIDEITTAADRLLSRGMAEIYDEPREALTRMYKRETGEDWVDPPMSDGGDDAEEQPATGGNHSWEYRWTDGRDGEGVVYGPYGATEMKGWRDAGFFGEGVEFRRAGETNADWSRIGEF